MRIIPNCYVIEYGANRSQSCSGLFESCLLINFIFLLKQYDDMPIDALMELVQQIVAFHMKVESLKVLLALNFLS